MTTGPGEFGDVFRAIRQRRGACPDNDRLAALVSGSIAGEDERGLREHIAMCGRCDALTSRMAALGLGFAGGGPSLRRWVWWSLPAATAAAAVVAWFLWAPRLRSPAAHNPLRTGRFVALAEASRGGAEPAAVAGTEASIVLAAIVPALPGHSYAGRIEPGAAGAPAITLTPSERGEIYVVLDRDRYASGAYSLIVTESDDAGRSTGRVFRYPFRL